MDHVRRNVILMFIVLKNTFVLAMELAKELVISINKPVHPVNTVILIIGFAMIVALLTSLVKKITNVPMVAVTKNANLLMIC